MALRLSHEGKTSLHYRREVMCGIEIQDIQFPDQDRKNQAARSCGQQGSQILCLKGGMRMLWTIFVILLILWLLGLVSGYTLGGVIHILLVIAIVVLVVRLIQGRRVL